MKQTASCRLKRFTTDARALVSLLSPASVIVAGTPPLWPSQSGGIRPDSKVFSWDAEFNDDTTQPGERYAKFSFCLRHVIPSGSVLDDFFEFGNARRNCRGRLGGRERFAIDG